MNSKLCFICVNFLSRFFVVCLECVIFPAIYAIAAGAEATPDELFQLMNSIDWSQKKLITTREVSWNSYFSKQSTEEFKNLFPKCLIMVETQDDEQLAYSCNLNQSYFQFVYGVLQWSAQVFIGEASWDRGSRLLSVGEGPQQIRLKGGRNRDLMKKALQVPKRKQESW